MLNATILEKFENLLYSSDERNYQLALQLANGNDELKRHLTQIQEALGRAFPDMEFRELIKQDKINALFCF
jgi:hypothetical protein